jgi:hypothetical protein
VLRPACGPLQSRWRCAVCGVSELAAQPASGPTRDNQGEKTCPCLGGGAGPSCCCGLRRPGKRGGSTVRTPALVNRGPLGKRTGERRHQHGPSSYTVHRNLSDEQATQVISSPSGSVLVRASSYFMLGSSPSWPVRHPVRMADLHGHRTQPRGTWKPPPLPCLLASACIAATPLR